MRPLDVRLLILFLLLGLIPSLDSGRPSEWPVRPFVMQWPIWGRFRQKA